MRKKKKPKEEQLELFVFVKDTMIIQDQLDLGITDKLKDVKPPADDDLFIQDERGRIKINLLRGLNHGPNV